MQGDISKCFDKIPHKVIINRVNNKIVCQKTLHLILSSLNAGYIDPETGKHVTPTEGTPQGSILSPVLANIVLHELDLYLEQYKKTFEKGKTRKINPEYSSITSRLQRLSKKNPKPLEEIRDLLSLRRRLPSVIYKDPNYKRIKYLRYADDFVILMSSNINDAKLTKGRIKGILAKKCGLTLNDEKTIISTTQYGLVFLGALCKNISANKAQFFVKNA